MEKRFLTPFPFPERKEGSRKAQARRRRKRAAPCCYDLVTVGDSSCATWATAA